MQALNNCSFSSWRKRITGSSEVNLPFLSSAGNVTVGAVATAVNNQIAALTAQDTLARATCLYFRGILASATSNLRGLLVFS